MILSHFLLSTITACDPFVKLLNNLNFKNTIFPYALLSFLLQTLVCTKPTCLITTTLVYPSSCNLLFFKDECPTLLKYVLLQERVCNPNTFSLLLKTQAGGDWLKLKNGLRVSICNIVKSSISCHVVINNSITRDGMAQLWQFYK